MKALIFIFLFSLPAISQDLKNILENKISLQCDVEAFLNDPTFKQHFGYTELPNRVAFNTELKALYIASIIEGLNNLSRLNPGFANAIQSHITKNRGFRVICTHKWADRGAAAYAIKIPVVPIRWINIQSLTFVLLKSKGLLITKTAAPLGNVSVRDITNVKRVLFHEFLHLYGQDRKLLPHTLGTYLSSGALDIVYSCANYAFPLLNDEGVWMNTKLSLVSSIRAADDEYFDVLYDPAKDMFKALLRGRIPLGSEHHFTFDQCMTCSQVSVQNGNAYLDYANQSAGSYCHSLNLQSTQADYSDTFVAKEYLQDRRRLSLPQQNSDARRR